MALIEYRIIVDENGTATVLQDVREIGPGDKIQFIANNPNTSIKFVTGSPFAEAAADTLILVPQVGSNGVPPLQVASGGQQKEIAQPVAVTKTNTDTGVPLFSTVFQQTRRTFHFQCGRVNGTIFTPWGGQGGNSPDGGSGLDGGG